MENKNNLPITNSRYPLPQQVARKNWKRSADGSLAISEAVWEFYSSNQLELREDKTKIEEIGWQIHITAELQENETLVITNEISGFLIFVGWVELSKPNKNVEKYTHVGLRASMH